MPWVQRPIEITAVQIFGCDLDESGQIVIRIRAEDGGELRLMMPLDVAAELRSNLNPDRNGVEIPAFRPFRGSGS